jgi:predicted nucleic acid-binding Zn ribbon protein
MTRRAAPRPLGHAIRAVRRSAAPATPLAAVQAVWAEAVGDSVASAAQPISERDGVLTVACESAVWAEQLDLMQGDVVARLATRLGDRAPRGLRCVTSRGRHLAGQPARE